MMETMKSNSASITSKRDPRYRRLIEGTRTNPDPDDLLTVTDLAAITKMHPRTIRSKIASGDIPGIRLGERGAEFRVRRSEFREWLDRQAVRG